MAEEKLHADIKMMVGRSKDPALASFGKGSATLLHGVEQYGSLNKTAKELGMAYSKAWTLIKRVEESLGFQLIERHGAHGSLLTEKGKDFLDRYDAFEKEIENYIDKIFDDYFGNF